MDGQHVVSIVNLPQGDKYLHGFLRGRACAAIQQGLFNRCELHEIIVSLVAGEW
jgi:hypothetical protein